MRIKLIVVLVFLILGTGIGCANLGEKIQSAGKSLTDGLENVKTGLTSLSTNLKKLKSKQSNNRSSLDDKKSLKSAQIHKTGTKKNKSECGMFGCPVDFDAIDRKVEQDMADGTTARKEAARRKEAEEMLGGNPFAFSKDRRTSLCDVDWKKMGASARENRKMKRECKDGDSEIDQFFNEMRALEQLQ